MAEDFVAFWHEEANKMLVGNILLSSDRGKNKAIYDFARGENFSSKLKKFKIKAIIYPIKEPVNLDFLKQLKETHSKALLIGLIDQNYPLDHNATNLFSQFDCLLPSTILPNQLTKIVALILKGNLCIPRFLLKSAQKASKEGQALKKPGPESKNDKNSFSLTTREAEIFQLVSKGYSNNEIAQELFLSLSTVKSHIYRIFRKSSFTNRVQTIIYQYQKGGYL